VADRSARVSSNVSCASTLPCVRPFRLGCFSTDDSISSFGPSHAKRTVAKEAPRAMSRKTEQPNWGWSRSIHLSSLFRYLEKAHRSSITSNHSFLQCTECHTPVLSDRLKTKARPYLAASIARDNPTPAEQILRTDVEVVGWFLFCFLAEIVEHVLIFYLSGVPRWLFVRMC
jgi:hypothetical protein